MNIIVLILLICCFSNVNADINDYVGQTWKSNTTNLRIQIFSSTDAFSNMNAYNYSSQNGIESYIRIPYYVYRSDDDDLNYEIQI